MTKQELGYSREWAKKNAAKLKAYKAAYYLANKERLRSLNIKWRRDNPDKAKALDTSNAASPKRRECIITWRKEHPEKVIQYSRNRRCRKLQSEGSFTSEQFTALCNHYGNACIACFSVN